MVIGFEMLAIEKAKLISPTVAFLRNINTFQLFYLFFYFRERLLNIYVASMKSNLL